MRNQRPAFWLVWNPQREAPTRQHDTKRSAEIEAERLARANRGQRFIVLQSIGERAVNYLRRARKAEELLRRCSRHLGQWAEWYGNADHAARGQLPLPPAGDMRLAEDIAEHLTPNVGGNRKTTA